MVEYTRAPIPGEGLHHGGHALPVLNGGSGGSQASSFPASDLTPELVRARFNSAQLQTRVTLINDNTLNAGTNHAGSAVVSTWFPVGPFDRPMIVWPIDVIQGLSTDSTGDALVNGLEGGNILYSPNTIPTTDADAYVSDGMGVCYLSNPGLWWLKYSNVAASAITKVTCLLLDASDPSQAAKIMNQAGCQVAVDPYDSSTQLPAQGKYFRLAIAAGSRVLAPASRNRSTLVIQNTGVFSAKFGGGSPILAGNSIRLGFGGIASSSAGILLAPGASMTLSGQNCWKGPITGICDILAAGSVGSPPGVQVDVVAQEFQ
jgi:hypothetical protein